MDIILTPAAKRLLTNLCIECKNKEQLVIPTAFKEHYKKYEKEDSLKLLIHTKNHSEVLVTLRWEDFVKILGVYLRAIHSNSAP